MEYSNSNGRREASASRTLTPESLNLFRDGIALVLSRWTALREAIESQWGGKNSLQKSYDLASYILSWFSQSKGPLDIHDLKNLLSESMLLLFNAVLEDHSDIQVAKVLMVMHEECLNGNYESIDNLRNSVPATNAVSHSRRVDNDEDESSDEDASEMMVDEPAMPELSVDRPKQKEMPDEEGWMRVAPRRNRGRRSA